jgi:DNA polymerase-3 subunit beta
MKLIVDSSALAKELKRISPVISKNTIIPIIEGVKIDVVGEVMTLTATDLNTTVSSKLDCNSSEDFSTVIMFHDLLDICSKSSGPLEMSVKGIVSNFVSDKAKYKLSNGFDPQHFPSVEFVDYLNVISVDGDFFFSLSGANATKSSETSLTQMNNIGIDFKKNKVSVLGISQMSMYRKDFPISCKKEIVASVGGKFVDLTKLFQESTVSVSEKFITAEYNNVKVVSRLSEVLFINYEPVFNQITPIFNWTVNRKDLIDSISVIGIASSQKTKSVIFSFSENKIDLKSMDIDSGKEAETVMNINHTVEEMEVTLNGSSLINILNTIDSEEVDIRIESYKSGIVIRPSSDGSTCLLIMPIINLN